MFLIKYLLVSVIIFLISFFGLIYNKKSILIILISIELILLSVNILFIVFSIYLDDIIGQIFTIFILTIAAAETSIGLSLLLVSYRVRGNILIDNFNLLYFLALDFNHFIHFTLDYFRIMCFKFFFSHSPTKITKH